MTEQEIRQLLEALGHVYKKVGKTVQTAVLHQDGEEKLIIDNRAEEDLN